LLQPEKTYAANETEKTVYGLQNEENKPEKPYMASKCSPCP
jgi:hypothetical protein